MPFNIIATPATSFFMRPSYTPLLVLLSFCLSVRLSRLVTRKHKRRKIKKLVQTFPRGQVKFQVSVEKIKGQGHRTSKTQNIAAYLAYIFTYGRQIKRRWLMRRLQTIGLTIVSLNLLSTPETLGKWIEGRISCRHSAPISFLVSC